MVTTSTTEPIMIPTTDIIQNNSDYWIQIDSVGDKEVGDIFTISGKSNLMENSEIFIDIKPGGVYGFIRIIKEGNDVGTWSFPITTRGFNTGSYSIYVQAIDPAYGPYVSGNKTLDEIYNNLQKYSLKGINATGSFLLKSQAMVNTTIQQTPVIPLSSSNTPVANDVYKSKDNRDFSVITEYSDKYDAVRYWRFLIITYPESKYITNVETEQSLINWIRAEREKQHSIVYSIYQSEQRGFTDRGLFLEKYPYKIGKFDGNYSNGFIASYDTYRPLGNITIYSIQKGLVTEEQIPPQ